MGTEQLSLLRQVVPTSVRMDIVQSHSHSLASVRYSHCFNQVISACEGGVSYAASISLNLVSQIRSLTFRREWAWGRGYNNLPISILYSVLNIWALYPLHGVKKIHSSILPLHAASRTTPSSITFETIGLYDDLASLIAAFMWLSSSDCQGVGYIHWKSCVWVQNRGE